MLQEKYLTLVAWQQNARHRSSSIEALAIIDYRLTKKGFNKHEPSGAIYIKPKMIE